MKLCGKLCRICETKIGAWPNAIGGEDFEINFTMHKKTNVSLQTQIKFKIN